MSRWSILLAALLSACGSRAVGEEHEPTPACAEFCAREVLPNSIPIPTFDCVACFEVDADGFGSCKANLNTAVEMELAALIRWTVSASDKHRAYGESCEEELCPLVEFLIERRLDSPYESLDDFDQRVSRPQEYGGEGLAGIDVRTVSGHNSETGDYWAGLTNVARVPGDAHGASCCINEACTGADFRCDEDALVQLPGYCEALSDSG